MKCAIGLDIGGTKVAAGLVDEHGKAEHVAVNPSDCSGEEALYSSVKSCIIKVLEGAGASIDVIAGVGAGTPGLVDRETGTALFSNNLPWRNFPLAERLHSDFGLPVLMDNDVCMAAYGEWAASGKAAKETFVYMTVSTGIACSIIHNGLFFRGAGAAGEIGLSIAAEQETEAGIAYQTLEELASGTALAPSIKQYVEQQPGQELFQYLQQGTMYHETAKIPGRLARSIYSVICLLDPHQIVLGGGVINKNPSLAKEICRRLDQYRSLREEPVSNRISLSLLKEKSGLAGAGLKMIDSM